MRYELEIKQPLQFFVNDQPDAEMQINKTDINGVTTAASDLLGATARWTKSGGAGFLYAERLMASGSGAGVFVFKAPSKVTNEVSGAILARIFENSGVTATIDSTITNAAASVDVTVTAGAIPASGFYKLESEWGEYTVSGSTVTLVFRGSLSTSPAAHTSGVSIEFSETVETAQPHFQYRVLRDENAL